MLERTSVNLEKISKLVSKRKGELLCDAKSRSEERKAMRELAGALAYNILKYLGYDFKFSPTPIYELANILNIEEKSAKNTLREAELYKTENGWTVIHREGTSWERKRFSFCHEIAHILLGYGTGYLPNFANDRLEEFCDKIAAELLVPSRLFKIYTLNDIQPVISHFLLREIRGRSNKVEASNDLRLNFAIFEAMRKHLQVSRFVLVQQLNWTKFLDSCESGIIISWESVNKYTGRTPALRIAYTALPTWGFIPMNTRIKSIGIFSALTAFDGIDYWKAEKWKETVKVKEKRDGKWSKEAISLSSCGEHVVLPFVNNRKYLFTTLGWENENRG